MSWYNNRLDTNRTPIPTRCLPNPSPHKGLPRPGDCPPGSYRPRKSLYRLYGNLPASSRSPHCPRGSCAYHSIPVPLSPTPPRWAAVFRPRRNRHTRHTTRHRSQGNRHILGCHSRNGVCRIRWSQAVRILHRPRTTCTERWSPRTCRYSKYPDRRYAGVARSPDSSRQGCCYRSPSGTCWRE